MSAVQPSANPFGPSPDAVEAIRLVEGPLTWLDRIADRLNPIFVKETRQALKSRQFVVSFLLLLAAGWLVSLFAILSQGAGSLEYGDAGRELFAAYFVVLAAAIVVVVPFGAFRSLLTEREDATYEPLIITTLSPRQIVLGKLYSALLQTFLFYSAIAPFMAFTALLQGFDIAFVSLVLALGVGISAWVCIAALAISAMVKGKVWQTIVSLGVLAGLVWAFGLTCVLGFETGLFDFDDPWFWWGLSAWIVAGLSYIALLQQVAVSNLTFHADNRSTGLRIICSVQFLMLWGGVVASSWYLRGAAGGMRVDEELVAVGTVLSLLHWTAAGLFFVTEEDELSQRITRRLPRNWLVRALAAPLYPGGHRGLAFVLGHLAITCGIAVYLITRSHVSGADALPLIFGATLYLVIYLNLAALVARWGMNWSRGIQPIHARVIALLLIALMNVTPMFAMVFEDFYSYRDYSLIYLPTLPMTLEQLGRNSSWQDTILVALAIWAGGMTLLNVGAMVRGLREVAGARPTGEEL